VLIHMSADMLDHRDQIAFQATYDGLTLTL
jgi:hypothetical protein